MRAAVLGAVAGIAAMASAPADIDFTISSISDSGGASSAYYDDIEAAILAAGEQWAKYLPQSGDLSIQIIFVNESTTISGGSQSFPKSGESGGVNVFQPGAAYELNTGIDSNFDAADIKFDIGTAMLSQLWFDPNPSMRTEPVPEGSYDAMSLFMRGFGRALGYFSYRNGDGSLNAAQSSFDLNVSSANGVPYFNGPNATAIHGGSVPLTIGEFNLPAFLGNENGPGSDLAGGLMGGTGIQPGTRYEISALDLAILADSGLETLPIPEPRALALLAMCLVVLAGFRATRARGVG